MNSFIKYWLLLSLPLFLQAQTEDFVFERFSTENGLPSSMVMDIVQDHEGYIWLATDDGLVRYDGYEFLTYRSIPGDSTSLSQNRVEQLYVDFTGDIWIVYKSTLDRYSSDCDCFIRYSSHESAPNNQQEGHINAFAEDLNNNLWIGSQGGGLVRLDLQTGSTKRFLHDPANPNSLIDNRVSALMEDQNGKLWVGTCQSGLHYFEPEKEEFIRMMPDAANDNQLYAPQDKMGLWSSCPHVRFIHQDQHGNFWVGTYNGGINHFDPVTKKLTHYEHNPADPGSLISNQIWSFLQDRQNRIWIVNFPTRVNRTLTTVFWPSTQMHKGKYGLEYFKMDCSNTMLKMTPSSIILKGMG